MIAVVAVIGKKGRRIDLYYDNISYDIYSIKDDEVSIHSYFKFAIILEQRIVVVSIELEYCYLLDVVY